MAHASLLSALQTTKKTRTFGTQGPVTPEKHYVVPRTAELADFLSRATEGRYLVIFAPRQTGKTTFFSGRKYIVETKVWVGVTSFL